MYIKKTKKTIYQWRLSLPPNLRKLFMSNILHVRYRDKSPSNKVSTLVAAVRCVDWSSSPQGAHFWDAVDDMLLAHRRGSITHVWDIHDGESLGEYASRFYNRSIIKNKS